MIQPKTPLPWRTEFNPTQKGNPATWIMQAGAQIYEKVIAECPWGTDGDTDSGDGDGKCDCTAAEAQANARYIVHAASVLPLCVEALKKMLRCCGSSSDWNGETHEALVAIEAALAAADKE